MTNYSETRYVRFCRQSGHKHYTLPMRQITRPIIWSSFT